GARMGWPGGYGHMGAEPGERRSIQALVGGLSAAGGEPERRDLRHEDGHGDRRPPRLAIHSGPDSHPPPRRGSADTREPGPLARTLRGAMYTERAGDDHAPFAGDVARLVDEVEEFLTGVRTRLDDDRVLATVMFTDIVGSTERAAAAGDRQWRDLLAQHHATL